MLRVSVCVLHPWQRAYLSLQVSINYLLIYHRFKSNTDIWTQGSIFLDHLWCFAFMKVCWRIEGNGEFRISVCVLLFRQSVWVKVSTCVCVCVQFSGFGLCEVNHLVLGFLVGRTHKPHSPLAGSHSYRGTGPLESIHLGFLCFLSS